MSMIPNFHALFILCRSNHQCMTVTYHLEHQGPQLFPNTSRDRSDIDARRYLHQPAGEVPTQARRHL